MQKCYYDVLGVNKDATEKEVKKAYRRMAMKFHPDRNPDDANAAEKFQDAKNANEVLTDDKLRKAYDDGGHDAVNTLRDGGTAGPSNSFTYEDVENEVLDDDYDPFASVMAQKTENKTRTAEDAASGSSARARRRAKQREARQSAHKTHFDKEFTASSSRDKQTTDQPKTEAPQAPTTVAVDTALLKEAAEKLKAAGETRLARQLTASITKARTNNMSM